jgi:hypothetical protein
MSAPEPLDTYQKALALNLDATIFGSFAEIGAGQEVARWFLRVGAASGTVAKTISAYDKKVSDELYGAGTRYVSRERLRTMLDREWGQLLSQLRESRGRDTRFFAFANSVSARNFAGTNECHGWMGIRFLERPGGEPSDVLLHLNLMDPANLLQQEALGIVGVNLVYGVHHEREGLDAFLAGLCAGLPAGRIEIDGIELRGPAFAGWDRRAALAELVRSGLAQVVTFPLGGEPLPPTELLHKRPVVLAPGSFEDVKPLHGRMLAAAVEALGAELGEAAHEPIGLFSLSAAPARDGEPPPDAAELLRRVDALAGQGAGLLLSRHPELYRTTAFVNRFSDAPIRFAVGIDALVRVFQDAHYQQLEGRMLEGIARLFAQNVRVYAFPLPAEALEARLRTLAAGGWQREGVDGWVSAEELRPEPPLSHLYDYLIASGFVVPMPPC